MIYMLLLAGIEIPVIMKPPPSGPFAGNANPLCRLALSTEPRFKLFAARRSRAAAMPFIMVTALIDMISIGLIIPVLPALVGSFTGTKTDQALWYGVVTFTFSFANFFGSPVLGALSDSYGRRPVLLIGFSGLMLSFFTTAMATSVGMLIAIRLVAGAMQANLSVANAYVADITPPEQRAKRFGMLGAMFGVGFILGPVIGGLLGSVSLRLPFYAAGSLALLNLLYGYFVLPESLPVSRRHAFAWQATNPFSALRRLGQLKDVAPLAAVVACTGLAQFVLYTCWVLYTTFKFGMAGHSPRWAWFRPSFKAYCWAGSCGSSACGGWRYWG
jgi:DHA1 family tetracycline resistance protein-like MFS transporter